jgi:hypothetical protein
MNSTKVTASAEKRIFRRTKDILTKGGMPFKKNIVYAELRTPTPNSTVYITKNA